MTDSERRRPFGPPPVAPPTKSRTATSIDPFAAVSKPLEPRPRRTGSREGLWVGLAALAGAAVVIALIASLMV